MLWKRSHVGHALDRRESRHDDAGRRALRRDPDAAPSAAKDGRIAWVGHAADLPEPPDELARDVRRCDGAWITPGFVDCHTHLVFGGDRAREFELRLQGKSYEEIARAGGGIVSTVAATRAATKEELIESAAQRLAGLTREGVTTVEIKSGYGLDLETELKMLEAAGELGARAQRARQAHLPRPPRAAARVQGRPRRLRATRRRRDDPRHRRGRRWPMRSMRSAKTSASRRRRWTTSSPPRAQNGLDVKLHAEQLTIRTAQRSPRATTRSPPITSNISTTPASPRWRRAGTVAVLLPGAFYFLREKQLPPIEELRKAGVHMAVASDCNPGTSPMTSPLAALNMACTLFRLTPEEALAGITREGARALGLLDEIGTLEVGKAADLAIWDINRPPNSATGSARRCCASACSQAALCSNSAHASRAPPPPLRRRGRGGGA